MTMNTVAVVPVLVVSPVNHDEPSNVMVGFPLMPVLLMVGVPVAVALLPSPDLSFHTEIVAPLAAGIPVAFGSAASSHNVGLPGNTVGNPKGGTVLAEIAEPDIVVINCVPFCTNDEMVKGRAAVTAENAVDGSDTFPPEEAVTVSVYVVPMMAEIFALVTPVTVPNCDPSAEFLRMNWVPATAWLYVHEALILVDDEMYVMDTGTGVGRVWNPIIEEFVLLGAPAPALFWNVNEQVVSDKAPEYVNDVAVDVVSVRLAGKIDVFV